MQKTIYSKIIITIIITSLLFTPALSVSAKKYKKHDNITEYRLSGNIIRFEEKVLLDIPDDYGMALPDGAYYTVNVYGISTVMEILGHTVFLEKVAFVEFEATADVGFELQCGSVLRNRAQSTEIVAGVEIVYPTLRGMLTIVPRTVIMLFIR